MMMWSTRWAGRDDDVVYSVSRLHCDDDDDDDDDDNDDDDDDDDDDDVIYS